MTIINPLLTEMYNISMAYAYWKAGKHLDLAVFDLFHRIAPFGGNYTVFAGLDECIRFVSSFRFEEDQIKYLHTIMPSNVEEEFYECLKKINGSDVIIHAIPQGSIVYPLSPLMRVEGPLWVVQMLEITFLTLVNYASLVATNAARHRVVAGKSKKLLEFGLRCAHGPDGGLTASKYSYLGGFDATSNLTAGRLFNIPVSNGTHSHSFVSAFLNLDEIVNRRLIYANNKDICEDFIVLVQSWLTKIQEVEALKVIFFDPNQSELASFSSYALAFPAEFFALVDTYDVMQSGIPNFCAVALALQSLGYKPGGIRIDSGDLAYFSRQARKFFSIIEKEFGIPEFGNMTIIASNNVTVEILEALHKEEHEIDIFAIGTHLVTCYTQPALGCVYNLAEINEKPRIKISADEFKITIPCKKQCYRLYGKQDQPLLDVLTAEDEPVPKVGKSILCGDPFNEMGRVSVIPQRVKPLYKCYWAGVSGLKQEKLPSLEESRLYCSEQLEEHLCGSHSPTPYKVLVSQKLYDLTHSLWLSEVPIGELL